MSSRLPISLSASGQKQLVAFVVTFGLTIIVWAFLHDLYLIHVEPRHFTEYHRQLLPISNLNLLALQYAAVATTGPGMVFGALIFVAARSRQRSRVPTSLRFAWWSLVPFLLAIEGATLVAGAVARHQFAIHKTHLYPDFLYPDNTAGIAYSQSVNITAYLGALTLGGAFLVFTYWRRRRLP